MSKVDELNLVLCCEYILWVDVALAEDALDFEEILLVHVGAGLGESKHRGGRS